MIKSKEKEKQELEKKRFNSTNLWRVKLYAGEWDEFIKATDEKITKSPPYVSRLVMLKNSIEYGYPSLALKLFKEKHKYLNQKIEEEPKFFKENLNLFNLLNLSTENEFLINAFDIPPKVLEQNKIKNKGEHLLYLIYAGTEDDVVDFIEKRIINMTLDEWEKFAKNEYEKEINFSFLDYLSLLHIINWFQNIDYIKEIEKIIIFLWFKKFKRDINKIKENKIFNFNQKEELKEKILFSSKNPYPALNINEKNENDINNIYEEIREAIDIFSFLLKDKKTKIMTINDYVYKYDNKTKKDFYKLNIYDKKRVLNSLYSSFHLMMENILITSPF